MLRVHPGQTLMSLVTKSTGGEEQYFAVKENLALMSNFFHPLISFPCKVLTPARRRTDRDTQIKSLPAELSRFVMETKVDSVTSRQKVSKEKLRNRLGSEL